MDEDKCVGAIVCKLDLHKKMVRRGYIAMLAVDENYRRRGIGKFSFFSSSFCDAHNKGCCGDFMRCVLQHFRNTEVSYDQFV